MTNLELLNTIKEKLADVYSSEVKDDIYDNGLLNVLNTAIVNVELCIKLIIARG